MTNGSLSRSLPPFTVEPVTEWMEQERQKREYEAQRLAQEQREKQRLEREAHQAQQNLAAGRGAGNNMRQKRRQETAVLNKYVVIRPNAPGAAASAVSSSAVAPQQVAATAVRVAEGTVELQPGIKRARADPPV